jgi:hypothetical protein
MIVGCGEKTAPTPAKVDTTGVPKNMKAGGVDGGIKANPPQ